MTDETKRKKLRELLLAPFSFKSVEAERAKPRAPKSIDVENSKKRQIDLVSRLAKLTGRDLSKKKKKKKKRGGRD